MGTPPKASIDFVATFDHEAGPEPVESTFGPAGAPDATRVPAEAAANPYGQAYVKQHYTFHHDVFVVFRPYEACPWCRKKMMQAELSPPPDGSDYVCPHTRRGAYLELVQKMLHLGYKKVSHREETLKNGTIQVSVGWAVPETKEERRRPPLGRL